MHQNQSRKVRLAQQIAQQQLYQRRYVTSLENELRSSRRSSVSSVQSTLSRFSVFTARTTVTLATRRSVYQPRYSMPSRPPELIARKLEEEASEAAKPWWYITCCFIAATLSACSSLYICDSIAAYYEYLADLMTFLGSHINESQIGWLQSVIYIFPLFMSIVSAPFIDKFGCIQMGIFMNAYNLVLSIPMLFVWDSFIGLLVIRIFAGAFAEATFLIQSQIIVQYLPGKYEGLGFGICTSISTSANLIGYFAIPQIMKGYKRGFWSEDPNQALLWKQKVIFTFWMNVIVAGAVLALFVLSCVPMLVDDKKKKQRRQEQRQNAMAPARASFTHGLQDFKQKIPNNLPWLFKLKKFVGMPFDYWLLNITYCLLLICCYGAQTMLLTFIAMHRRDSEVQGIIRSMASMVGGFSFGFLVTVIGQRCLIQAICYLLALASYVGLFFSATVPPYLSMFLIGFFDGSAATLGKSLFAYVVSGAYLSNAYAFSDTILNIGQFLISPIAGAFANVNWPVRGSGILWCFMVVLTIGFCLNVWLCVRDVKMYNKALSMKPK